MKYILSFFLICCLVGSTQAQDNWVVAGSGKIRSGKRVSIVPVEANAVYYSDNNYKLSIDGNFATEEVLVQIDNEWPDFVFLPTYELPSLPQVAQFINERGHLPGIPAQAAVEAAPQGLGQVHQTFLQKVEELTLYLIESHERKERLLAEIEALEAELGL